MSTEEQADRQTVEAQRDFLQRYVELHGLDCHNIYVDDGVSGTVPLGERPHGRRLLDDAVAGRFGAVLVYRLDRLGRNLRALLEAHDQLDRAGVAIRSTTEPFDTSTPIGQFLFQLLGSLAELEKATIVERTTLGRDRVARAGKWTTSTVPFGYDLDAAGCLVPSERLLPSGRTEADTVREVYERVASGATLPAECRRLEALGIPSITRRAGRPDEVARRWWNSRLHKLLRSPLYRGSYMLDGRNGPIIVPVPALVSPQLWERAQHAMTENRDLSTAPGQREYLLRGLVRCRTVLEDGTVCGRTYSGAPGSKRLPDGSQRLYYHCSGVKAHPNASDRARCFGRSIPMAALEQTVWQDVRAFVRNPGRHLATARAALEARRTSVADTAPEHARLERALADRAAERERAQLLFRRGLADLEETELAIRAVDADIAELQSMIGALEADEAAVQATAAHLDEAALLVGSLHPLVDAGDAGDRVKQREVIELLVREVSITTRLGPGSKRAKHPKKLVSVVVRYRWSPGDGNGRALGSIPPALPERILPNLGTITLDRELVLVRAPRTTVVHVRDGFDVYIGRAVRRRGFAGSKWANPFPLAMGTREQVIEAYRRHLLASPDLLAALPELRGKRLGCWCKGTQGSKDVPCHGDVLAELTDTIA